MLPLLVVPFVAAVLAVLRHTRRMGQQRQLASPGVWSRLMGGVPATGLLRMLAWSTAAALVVLALARPQWGELPASQSVRTRDLVVALDVSDSMLCPDLRPSRLDRSLQMVQRSLPAFEGNRVGVVVFAGDAYPLVPLTGDLNAVVAFLDVVRPQMVALPGSNLERAVSAALRLLPTEGEGRVVVLITDGENLQGNIGAAAQALEDAGVGVLAVVAGTEDGGPIPVPGEDGGVRYKRDANDQPVVTRARPEVLAELAEAVDGDVLELERQGSVEELVRRVEGLRTRELEETVGVRRVERFQIFLVAAAAMLALGFGLSPWRRVATVSGLVLLLLVPGGAAAQGVNPTADADGGRSASAKADADARQMAGVDAGPTAGAKGGPEAGDTRAAEPAESGNASPVVSWWQRLIPGGSRRLARSGAARWSAGELEQAAQKFAGAATLDPENPDRLYDLGTVLAAGGQMEVAAPLLKTAHEGGSPAAAFNGGTAALGQGQAEQAVQWLRQALLRNPDDPEVKRNYELALKLLEQQQQQQQQQQQNQDQQENDQPSPTPTPSQQPQGAPPTPTPDMSKAVLAALDRAEAEAREQMRSPTPQASEVEQDW
jgi:Ca-activated chloride channel family protein